MIWGAEYGWMGRNAKYKQILAISQQEILHFWVNMVL